MIQYFRHEWSSIMYENTKKHNKIKRRSITCSCIWHANISKCLYWLDKHSVKVWWRYVLPNVNAAHFCDVFFRHRAVFPSRNKKTSLEFKNLAPSRWYTSLLVNISGLYISWCWLQKRYRLQTTDRIPKLPTDRHFLDLSETC